MNKKGQALVEFVLILPILLMVLLAIIDIGNIFLQKYNLNNELDTVSTLYQNGKDKELRAYVSKENLSFSENRTGDIVTLTLEANVDIKAPVLNKVLGKKHKIKTDKKIIMENGENKNE